MLNRQQQTTLLQIARDAISGELRKEPLALDVASFDEVLQRPAGAFVTLRDAQRDLRGCIGSVAAVAPLCQAVASSAINAAFRDPRFPPLRTDEWPGIDLEISVMGPILAVDSIDDIVCGRDGLIVSDGPRAGLLLPQVATEQGWDRETFLAHACLKAGLEREAWKRPAVRISRFQAHVFSEQTTDS